MHKRPLALAAVTLTLLTGATLVSMNVQTASASLQGCVSDTEWNQLENGMTMARVHRIVGTTGVANSGDATTMGRFYRECGPGDETVDMVYKRQVTGSGEPSSPWRLRDKSR